MLTEPSADVGSRYQFPSTLVNMAELTFVYSSVNSKAGVASVSLSSRASPTLKSSTLLSFYFDNLVLMKASFFFPCLMLLLKVPII